MAEPDRPQMTIQRTRFACWVTKAARICNTVLHGNNGYANAPQCYVYTYIGRLIWSQ